MQKLVDLPLTVRQYRFYGLDLSYREGMTDVTCRCPFCDRDGKFSINVDTGQFRCFVCQRSETHSGIGGNIFSFMRLLYGDMKFDPEKAEDIRQVRKFLRLDSLEAWGLRWSHLTGECMIPGYGGDGKMKQLYRYFYDIYEKRWKLYPCPKGEVNTTAPQPHHQLHGMPLYDPEKPDVYLCEGIWDAIALWEVMRSAKWDGSEATLVLDRRASMWTHCNVLAIPTANVFSEVFLEAFENKNVYLMFDNDHPVVAKGKRVSGAGILGMKRAAGLMLRAEIKPETCSFLKWGDGEGDFFGYSPDLKNGYDVRDALTASHTLKERVGALSTILQKLTPVPGEWASGASKVNQNLKCQPCTNWETLTNSFRKALKWTEGMDRALSVMLACVISTEGVGDQLWCKVMGPPACGKTTLAEAIAVSRKYVIAKSTIRGLHSGSTQGLDKEKDPDANNSLIAHLRNRTLVIKDADTIINGSGKDTLLSEFRDLYDRTARSDFKNGQGKDWFGINCTVIICGTNTLRDFDASEKGCRFIDCVIMKGINFGFERDVTRMKLIQVRSNRGMISNGKPETQHPPDLTEAYQYCGGFVEYLRRNASELQEAVQMSDERLDECMALGQFVSFMRARPGDVDNEVQEREFAVRLCSQFTRLAICLAAVFGKSEVDDKVMKRVRTCAMDTARGDSLEMARRLYDAGRDHGLSSDSIAVFLGKGSTTVRTHLMYLRAIGAAELFDIPNHRPGLGSKTRWRLTEVMYSVYGEAVHGIPCQLDLDSM